jgi:hypothetical protein
VFLKALSDFDRARFDEALAPLEAANVSNPNSAAQLLGWLNEIGRGDEAARWGRSLAPAVSRRPPVAPGIAEALRTTGRWQELRDWVGQADWGLDLGFMGSAYGFVAARRLDDGPGADSLWRSLSSDAKASPAHALFAGDSLVAWGYPREAAELLWVAADRPDLAFQALGTLARLYQLQRDAPGLYRAFSRLNAMRPGDREIANNYAYYAALTNEGSQIRIEQIAEDNFTHEPSSAVFRSTYAFVLVWTGKAAEAMTLLEPLSRDWRKSQAVAFAYGAALAGLGRQSEARVVFDSLDPRELFPQEVEWIRAALH